MVISIIKNSFILLVLMISACTANVSPVESTISSLEQVTQELVFPLFLSVHQQIAIKTPKVVEIRLVVEEKEIQVSGDVIIQLMTFNGSVPSPIIVVHQDDYVKLTLVNPLTNLHVHHINFHAATDALVGGEISKVNPGEEITIRFKAIKAGLFLYHWAPFETMIPYHVVTGINGVTMVLPGDGLKDNKGVQVQYDKAYYIGEQDYYIPREEYGEFKQYSSVDDAIPDTLDGIQT